MVNATTHTIQGLPATSPELRQRYVADGVVLVPQVFTSSEIDDICKQFTELVENDPAFAKIDHHIAADDILSRYPRFVMPHRRTDSEVGKLARRFMVDERLVNIASQLLGPVYGAQSMFYFKPPTARGQALHQDNFFLQAHPETCLAAWIAIDDSDASNGGLRVIPGSHKNEVLCHDAADPKVSFTKKTVRAPASIQELAIQTSLHAGDVLFFHGSLVHGSLANTSDRFRRALIYHYIPQSSEEVAWFYHPLIAPDGAEVEMNTSPEGGPCGEGWAA